MPQSFLLDLIPSGCGVIEDVLHLFIAVALLFVVLSTFFRPWITSEKGKSITNFVEYRGPMLLGLLIGGLVCGTIGNFIDHYAKLNPPPKKYFSSGESVQTKDDKAKEESDGLSPYLTDKFYLSWTQFFADGKVTPRDSFWTRIGRLFGLAFVSLLAYDAYTKLFSQEILDSIIKRQRSHTLICGSGRIGTVLAKNLLQDKSKVNKVTVIEKDPNSPALDELRELGANVMIADATLRRNIERARCDLAKEIFVVTGSDEANLDIAADLIELLSKSNTQEKVPSVHVHLHQMRLESVLLKSAETDPIRSKSWKENLKAFNPLSESIRYLFDDYILVRRPKTQNEVAHYVIVGFGNTGQQLALFLAENAHFVNLKRARMTIVHRPDEQQAVDKFRKLYPKFFPTGQNKLENAWEPSARLDDWGYGVVVHAHQETETRQEKNESGQIEEKEERIWVIEEDKSRGVSFAVNGGFSLMEGGVTSPEFTDALHKLCKASDVRPIVFICNSNDEENCAEAIELRELLDLRLKVKDKTDGRLKYQDPNDEISIFAYVPDRPSLFELINKQNPSHRPDLIAWGDCQSSCKYEQLKSDMIDQLARKIYEQFCKNTNKINSEPNKKTVENRSFLETETWQILSNRKAASHINAKLSVCGLQVIHPGDTESAKRSQPDRNVCYPVNLNQLALGYPTENGQSASEELTEAPLEKERFKELLARIEQNRYLAERLLQDWSLGNKKTPENCKRSGMVDWDNLMKKDLETVYTLIQSIIEFIYSKARENQSDTLKLVSRQGESNELNDSTSKE